MAVIRIGNAPTDTVATSGLSNNELRGLANNRRAHFVPVDAVQTLILTTERPITYRKRGYLASTAQYEYWLTTIRDAPPPTGNPLIDITVVSEYYR